MTSANVARKLVVLSLWTGGGLLTGGALVVGRKSRALTLQLEEELVVRVVLEQPARNDRGDDAGDDETCEEERGKLEAERAEHAAVR